MEHALSMLVQAWVRRGARNVAIPINDGRGWELRLCWRAHLLAWIFSAMFTTGLVGAILLAPGRPGSGWVVAAYVGLVAVYQYYVAYVTRYRVQVDEEGMKLFRFLIRTRELAWSDVTDFSLDGDEETVRFKVTTGKPLVIYSSLNGLSAIRRCLAWFTIRHQLNPIAWSYNDVILSEKIPSWRCDANDLETDPFLPLGAWKELQFEETEEV